VSIKTIVVVIVVVVVVVVAEKGEMDLYQP